MGLIKDLSYRVERFFCGERGKIEEIKLEPRCCREKFSFSDNSLYSSENRIVNYFAESSEDIPIRIKFRNPLGELIERVHCYGYLKKHRYEEGGNYS